MITKQERKMLNEIREEVKKEKRERQANCPHPSFMKIPYLKGTRSGISTFYEKRCSRCGKELTKPNRRMK